MFTLLAGPTEERILVHEAVLAGSPVFRAMTGLPFKEKEEQVIRLPDDEPSHIRCVVALLYTGDFSTPSECDHQAQDVKHSHNEGEGPSSKCVRIVREDGVWKIVPDLETSVPDANVQTGTELFSKAERAIAEDLAQIFMLGDKYQLPELKRCALRKLDKWFEAAKHPMHFLHLVTILNLHIPESDSQFRNFVQTNLQKGLPQSRDKHTAVMRSVIENGFMRQSGVLAEEIFSAYAFHRSQSDSDIDSEISTYISGTMSLSEAKRRLQRVMQ